MKLPGPTRSYSASPLLFETASSIAEALEAAKPSGWKLHSADLAGLYPYYDFIVELQVYLTADGSRIIHIINYNYDLNARRANR